MLKMEVFDLEKKKVGSVNLSEDVFNQRVNNSLVLQVIKAHLAGLRQGTASTKTKGLVRGGGKKPFKQKGTGNARQGSSRSPLMPGGGSSFGPVPRKYNQNTPKKMYRAALKAVLTDKAKCNRILVLESLNIKDAKTKDVFSIFSKNLGLEKALVVDRENPNLKRATSNLSHFMFLRADLINVYDLVKYEWLVISQSALDDVIKRLG